MIKKLFTLLVTLSLILISAVTVCAVENDFKMNINIKKVDNDYVVEIEDDPYYKNYQPTIFVNTDFKGDVFVYNQDNELIYCTNKNGEVDFKVSKGGTYYISKTMPYIPYVPVNPNKPKAYIIPVTGVN